MRVALAAVCALALCAAAPHRAAPRHAVAVVRAQAISGGGQTQHAYASTSSTAYVTDFPRELVVAVTGPQPRGEKRKVRFSCVTKGCAFAPAENGEGVERVDPAAYDVEVVRGRASVRIAVAGPSPTLVYTISAEPVTNDNERAIATTFTLKTM